MVTGRFVEKLKLIAVVFCALTAVNVLGRGKDRYSPDRNTTTLVKISRLLADVRTNYHTRSLHIELIQLQAGSAITTGLDAAEEGLSKLHQELRRLIRDQIVADCAKNTGICTGTKVSEIACRETKVEEHKEGEPAAPAAGAKKDDKKKK